MNSAVNRGIFLWLYGEAQDRGEGKLDNSEFLSFSRNRSDCEAVLRQEESQSNRTGETDARSASLRLGKSGLKGQGEVRWKVGRDLH